MNLLISRIVVKLALLAGFQIAALTAHAQTAPEAGVFSLELNSATDVTGSCRLTYVANNATGTPLDKTSYQMVIFDKDGGVLRFIVFEFGAFQEGKTKVVRFDIGGQTCDTISRLLVNDIDECVSNGAPSEVCLSQVKTSTRTEIAFGL